MSAQEEQKGSEAGDEKPRKKKLSMKELGRQVSAQLRAFLHARSVVLHTARHSHKYPFLFIVINTLLMILV